MTGLTPSLWRMLPEELVHYIAEALRDSSLKQLEANPGFEIRSLLKGSAMTCRRWRKLLSPLLFRYSGLRTTESIRDLEKVICLPSSGGHKDHIHWSALLPHPNVDVDDFFSAWRSLSGHLHQLATLSVSGSSSRILKSSLVKLRPCPQPLRHLECLVLSWITFPSFQMMFRTIGAIPSLERLSLLEVRWNGACDPDSPPSSPATYRTIKNVWVEDCPESWPTIWIFTTSSLRYGQPLRPLDIVEEARTRSVRADVQTMVQAFRWMYGNLNPEDQSHCIELQYVESAPKGM